MEHIIGKLLEDFERGRMSRRQLIQSLALAATAASAAPLASAEGKGFKAVAVNHISYQVADYAKTRDFYVDLLGMKVSHDDGKQCYLAFGDTFLLPRNVRRRTPNPDAPPPDPAQAAAMAARMATPHVDHIAYTIENWDKDAVKAELERRGLKPTPDTDNSFHIKDPDGFNLQISGKDMNAA